MAREKYISVGRNVSGFSFANLGLFTGFADGIYNAVYSLVILEIFRSSAIVAVANKDIPIFEYEANKIKKALTGAGHADKSAVDKMVQILLPNAHPKTADEADAIAIALAHTNTARF